MLIGIIQGYNVDINQGAGEALVRPGLLLGAGRLQTHAHRGPGGPQHDKGGPLSDGLRAHHA